MVYQRTRRFLALALLLPLLLVINGCPKDPYTAAMAGSKDVSDAVAGVLPVLQELERDKSISIAQTNEVLEYLIKVTKANQSFRVSVKQVHTSGQTGTVGYLNAADVFLLVVQNQQIVNLPPKIQPYLTAIETAIHGIEVAVANAKGVK